MTREEAIKEMREKLPWLTEDTKRLVESLIPELRESEDERIRKGLIGVVSDIAGGWPFEEHRITKKEAIAYLEKQKEHQFCSDAPKEKSVGGDFYSSHKDKNLDELSQEYVDSVKQYNQEPTWDLVQTAVCYGANWQKEQFEKNRLANCDALSKEECDRETDFAMEIIEKEHRQPTFNDAINYGMRLQKEQKPAEWSEEDTEMYINVASSLRGYACGLENEEHKRHIKKGLDWLENRFKSFRPFGNPVRSKAKED